MARTVRLRHIRYSRFARTSRQRHLRAFLKENQATLSATANVVTFTSAGNGTLTRAAHGFKAGDGPFLTTTTGTLPSGLRNDTLYWIRSAPDANTVTLSGDRYGPAISITSTGTGTHSIARSATLAAVYEHLRNYGPAKVRDAVDIDNL